MYARFLLFIGILAGMGGIFLLIVWPMIRRAATKIEHKLETVEKVEGARERGLKGFVNRALSADQARRMKRKFTDEEIHRILRGDSDIYDEI